MNSSHIKQDNAVTEDRPVAGDCAPPPAYRWTILFIVWAAFLMSYIDRVAWSSVAAPVGQSIGIAVSMLGAFVTAFYFGYVAANAIGGLVTDALGGRRTLALALLPLGIATFCFGEVRTLSGGILIQAIMGLAAGADYSAGVKIITAWFDKDRGRAMGIYVTATSLAVVAANFFVPRISAAYGWSSAFHILGVGTCVWALVAILLVRDAPPRIQPQKPRTADLVALIRNRNLILLAVAGGCAWWAVVGFSAWGNALMTKEHGVSPVTAGSIAACVGVGAAIAKPVMGWVSDLVKGRRKYLMSGTLLCYSILLVVFSTLNSVTQLYILAPVLGVVAFGYIPILMAQVTECSGKKAAGAAAGMTNAVWQLGSALSPMVVGQVYSYTHSLSSAMVTLAVGPLLAAVIVLFIGGGAYVETSAETGPPREPASRNSTPRVIA